jgi:hypothetical protein
MKGSDRYPDGLWKTTMCIIQIWLASDILRVKTQRISPRKRIHQNFPRFRVRNDLARFGYL